MARERNAGNASVRACRSGMKFWNGAVSMPVATLFATARLLACPPSGPQSRCSGANRRFSKLVASWRRSKYPLLAMTDKCGTVEASLPGLADFAHVSIEDCERAIANLQKPDKYSRSQNNDGRRIERIDGGWLVLNHAKYRDKMSEDDRRGRDRERQHRHRQRRTVTRSVTRECDMSRMSRHTDTDAEKKNMIPQIAFAGAPAVPFDDTNNSKPTETQIECLYGAYPRKREKLDAKRAIRKAVTVVMAGDADHPAMPLEEALDYLAQRVTLYALSVQSCEPNYLPYPASWFNAGSFWDDERDWDINHRGKSPGARKPMDYTLTPDEAERRAGLEAARTVGARN